MKTAAQTTFVERAGRNLGRLWRGCARLERRAAQSLIANGFAPGVAKALLLLVKLAALGVLLYVAVWFALLLAFVVAAAWMARDVTSDESEEWAIGDQADHKRSVFYDPMNYSDDPDPRFKDER